MSIGFALGIIAAFMVALAAASVVLYLKVVAHTRDVDALKLALDGEFTKIFDRLGEASVLKDTVDSHTIQFSRLEEQVASVKAELIDIGEKLILIRAVAEKASEDVYKFHKAADQVTKISKFPRLVRNGARLNG